MPPAGFSNTHSVSLNPVDGETVRNKHPFGYTTFTRWQHFNNIHLLLNLRSPRDCGSCRLHLWYFLSPLDGASVREAHCAQASTAVRRTEAPSLVRWMALQCAKRTAHRLALQCAALKRHARRLALQCASVREAHCAQATGRPV